MSETTASLRRKIDSAGDLHSVVRTMKALAASSIGQYEKSVLALADYHRTIELGLSVYFRNNAPLTDMVIRPKGKQAAISAIVFGSDQGLVGQFNDLIADFAVTTLASLPGKTIAWAVGERVHARLDDAGIPLIALFPVPNSVKTITPLIARILVETETRRDHGETDELYLFYNRPTSSAAYAPVTQRLLPLDKTWLSGCATLPWPTANLPEIVGDATTTLRALIREYLFVSLFRACAESLASENASRLSAMQRAEKNIDELLKELKHSYHRLRQNSIDSELFDVISGYESLTE
jgi:F-type H+-transporting ATPase subunit gamma